MTGCVDAGGAPEASVGMLRASLIPVEEYPDLERDWLRVEADSDGSPFICWRWMSTWLRHLPADVRPYVVSVRRDRNVVAIALCVLTPERGIKRLFGTYSLWLNETGLPELDKLTIEYNRMLASPGFAEAAYRAFFDLVCATLPRFRWLRISATEECGAIQRACRRPLRAYRITGRPSYFVDLDSIRASGSDYLAHLSSAMRSTLRSTRKAFLALGPLRIETARTSDDAERWLEEMKSLHQAYWQQKGSPGAFASGFFEHFHRDLVVRQHESGFARLVRVFAGPSVLGVLYLLDWKGTLYYYNSGLRYGLVDRHDRPGLLAHLLVVEAALSDGVKGYDFLAGDHDYKRRLSTAARSMHWMDVRTEGWLLGVERFIANRGRRRQAAEAVT